jgi:hypothetical protein
VAPYCHVQCILDPPDFPAVPDTEGYIVALMYWCHNYTTFEMNKKYSVLPLEEETKMEKQSLNL